MLRGYAASSRVNVSLMRLMNDRWWHVGPSLCGRGKNVRLVRRRPLGVVQRHGRAAQGHERQSRRLEQARGGRQKGHRGQVDWTDESLEPSGVRRLFRAEADVDTAVIELDPGQRVGSNAASYAPVGPYIRQQVVIVCGPR